MNQIKSFHLLHQARGKRVACFSRHSNCRYFSNPSESSMNRLHGALMQLIPLGWTCQPSASGGYFMFPPPKRE